MAENILVGPLSLQPDAIERAFMASPSHREAILAPRFSAVGFGMASSSDGRLWVAVEFGG
jgi:uncharacterized protein YkwD